MIKKFKKLNNTKINLIKLAEREFPIFRDGDCFINDTGKVVIKIISLGGYTPDNEIYYYVENQLKHELPQKGIMRQSILELLEPISSEEYDNFNPPNIFDLTQEQQDKILERLFRD